MSESDSPLSSDEYSRSERENMDYTIVTQKRRASFSHSRSDDESGKTLLSQKSSLRKKTKKKKRNLLASQEPIATSNKFAALAVPDEAEPSVTVDISQDVTPKKHRVPPIVIKADKSHSELCSLLDRNTKMDYTLKNSGESIKLTLGCQMTTAKSPLLSSWQRLNTTLGL